MMKVLLLTLALLCAAPAAARAQGPPPPAESNEERLARILERAGEGVERYHRGLFSIAFTEVLRREELRKDLTAKKSEEFVFETVVVREGLSADGEDYYPKSVRRLKSVDGKPPKRGERPTTQFNVASLNFLLPKNVKLSEFSLDGEETLDGRAAFRIRWRRPGDGETRVEWKGTNFQVVSAPIVYLFWIDAETFDVLRLKAHLAAPFEFDSPRAFKAGPFGRFGPSRHLRYEVQDYSVRFRRQRFEGPEQTLLVPESAESLTVIEGASRPRLRTTVRFSDYRRFRSDVKVVEEPDGEGSRQ